MSEAVNIPSSQMNVHFEIPLVAEKHDSISDIPHTNGARGPGE